MTMFGDAEPLVEQDDAATMPEEHNGAASDVRRLPFPQSIAIEKTDAPLPLPNSISSQLRRRLLHGEALTADDGIAAGGTSGLLGAAARLMEEWGFEFEHGVNAEGKKSFKLANPDHVPVEQTRKPPGPSRVRKSASSEAEKQSNNPVHNEIRDRLLQGEEISITETMEMGASSAFLRKLVNRLQDEGYKFGVRGFSTKRSYILMTRPKGRPRGSTNKPHDGNNTNGNGKGKTLARTPLTHVDITGNNDPGPMPTNAVDMLFAELTTPAPRLGGAVRIMGAALNEEDDSVSVIFKNGTGAWKARLEAYVEADDSQ